MKFFFIVILLLQIMSASGQIIFKEFNPPLELYVNELYGDTSKSLYLDLNDDEINDIRFTLKYWYSFYTPSHDEAFMCSLNTQHQFCSQENGFCKVTPLNLGDTINENLNWSYTIEGSAGLMITDGPFRCNNFNSDRYIGIKLILDNEYFYSWIKVKTFYQTGGYGPDSWAKLLILDYAFNTEPHQGIITGDTLTSLYSSVNNTAMNNDIIIYPNPVSTRFSVETNMSFEFLSIVNVFGQEVYRKKWSQEIERINCSLLSNGIYFVKLLKGNQTFTKKIIVNH